MPDVTEDDITREPTDIKKKREYFKKLYFNKFDNLV